MIAQNTLTLVFNCIVIGGLLVTIYGGLQVFPKAYKRKEEQLILPTLTVGEELMDDIDKMIRKLNAGNLQHEDRFLQESLELEEDEETLQKIIERLKNHPANSTKKKDQPKMKNEDPQQKPPSFWKRLLNLFLS